MKNITKIFAIALVALGFSATSFAQTSTGSTANATASATIETSLQLNKNVDMNFGIVAVNSEAGTVVLTPAAGATRSKTGGVTLPATIGTVTAAKFTVSGTASTLYHIYLPTSVTVTDPVSSSTMIVNAFTSTPTPTGTLSGLGSDLLYVGATLNVNANQTNGTYVSSPFPVTVDYN